MHSRYVPQKALLVFLAGPITCLWAPPATADKLPPEGLSSDSPAIHQEVPIGASCARVYQALTDARAFDALTRLSDAVALVTAPNAKATAVSARAGAPFTLFGGYITGRNLELVSDQRLVQAWRTGGWDAGEYSIVRFTLRTQDAGCLVTLDHRGFPRSQGESLAYGWRAHYWEPLAKLLSRQP